MAGQRSADAEQRPALQFLGARRYCPGPDCLAALLSFSEPGFRGTVEQGVGDGRSESEETTLGLTGERSAKRLVW